MKYLGLLFFIVIFGCTAVSVSTGDRKPPLVSLIGASNGNTITTNGASVSKTMDYVIGQDVAVLASTSDKQGAKSIKLMIVSGAKLEVPSTTTRPGRPRFTNELSKSNQVRNGKALDSVTLGAKLIPTSPIVNMVIKAIGEDFANNVVSTKTLTFIPRPPTYVEDCEKSEVPIPPAFGENGWKYIGNLKEEDILSDPAFHPLYIWKYVSNNPKGLCAATVRYKKGTTQKIPTSKKNVEVTGIICQSTQTGKACFWHSKQSGKKFGADVKDMVDANHIKTTTPPNNKPLKCTYCHLGKNAFVVHPDTVLKDFSIVPKKRYMPVSNKFNATSNEGDFWSNPKSKLNLSNNQCGGCHDFGVVNSVWCDEVFEKVLGKTMPPNKNLAQYKDDIDKIKNACRNAR